MEFVEGISKEEAARFDRIAASLIAKIDQVEDYIEGIVVSRKPVLPDKVGSAGVAQGSLAQPRFPHSCPGAPQPASARQSVQCS